MNNLVGRKKVSDEITLLENVDCFLVSRISCKPFEEVLSALERHSLKLVDKQRAEDPLAIEILRKLGYSVSPLSSFQVCVALQC